MPALDPTLRRTLEARIIAARDAAEEASETAIKALAVHEKEPYRTLGSDERRVRNQLRARARQLGTNPETNIDPLVAECAYEQWHQMLFARFLAENHLLMHPEERVSVTLEDCAELAPEEGDLDAWATAARYASRMLPGIFRTEDPVLKIRLFPEGRHRLEQLLEEIPPPTFTADDGLGWVYQFWQTKAKKEVNDSGRKIGGADLPAVTQLFTEDYMVKFLLHNTLGAWWAARHPESPINADLEYLRRLDDGTPAAGTFPGWPERVADLKVLDPCCGSGHFLTAATDLLRRMRMEEEGLSEAEAAEAVLRDNIYGLELDARCTQLAAFALALQAWNHGGYRELPIPHVACSGLPAGGRVEEWTRLGRGDMRLEETLRRLHALFRNAPDLGSLIDPSRVSQDLSLEVADFEETETLLDKALACERNGDDPTTAVFGEAARGIVRAAALLKGHYQLVATNVPYLARGKQNETLKDHLDRHHPAGKPDLATAFIQRGIDYCTKGGTYAVLTPQNWLYLGIYTSLRERLLKSQEFNLVARLGVRAFQTPMYDFNVAMEVVSNVDASIDHGLALLDADKPNNPIGKATALREAHIAVLSQGNQLNNPDARVGLETSEYATLLSKFARAFQGVKTGDDNRYRRTFWELGHLQGYRRYQSTVDATRAFGGPTYILDWRDKGENLARLQGVSAWEKVGVAISQMGNLPAALFSGDAFDSNVSPIIPKDVAYLPAIWAFCSSYEYNSEVRKVDQSLKPTNSALTKIPFDLERWQRVADEQYPDGLPKPYSDDPTQWLFHGHPAPSTAPLQVAVARLLGYHWPAETDEEMELSDEARAWISRCGELEPFADPDGIACLPAVAGEQPAAERLRALLARAYGERWSPGLLEKLLSGADHGGKDLHTWLRDKFFDQHRKLFHNRPFIWHVWDGRKDGFSALVNYHGLDRAKLEKLIYTYLGSYISARRDEARSDVAGADVRLAAAENLKARLEAILLGEPPYDIYVRWKPRHEQPIGWEPDLNDGVRLNVRPFVEAGVLRSKFTINWKKDRGKNPDGSERHNDLHLTHAEKEEARRELRGVS